MTEFEKGNPSVEKRFVIFDLCDLLKPKFNHALKINSGKKKKNGFVQTQCLHNQLSRLLSIPRKNNGASEQTKITKVVIVNSVTRSASSATFQKNVYKEKLSP